MLQASVSNVLFAFSDVCCKCTYLDVAYFHTYATRVCFNCFRYFRGMLQVFHMDATIIDRDVTHVSMVVHVCCKRPL